LQGNKIAAQTLSPSDTTQTAPLLYCCNFCNSWSYWRKIQL